MKKYFVIAAAAAVAMTACTKTTIVEAPQQEVSFQVANYAPGTKADKGVKYDTAVPFGTYAWFQGEADGTQNQEFMVNTKIAYANSVWKAANATYYWPKSGSIDFISYSPFNGTDGNAATVPAVTATSITYTDYVVDGTDILYADKATGCTYSSTKDGAAVTDDAAANTTDSKFTGVPTLFRHALAQVNFQFVTADVNYKYAIKKVELLNVIKKGTLTLGLNDDKKTWNLPTTVNPVGWAPADEPEYAVVEWTDPLAVESKTVPTKYATPKNLLVLPQTLTNVENGTTNQTIKITADITITTPQNKTVYEKDVELTGVLYNTSVSVWGMNKSILYTITLSPGHEIYFDPAVVDWIPVESSATAI